MKIFVILCLGLFFSLVLFGIYVRLAPSDPARWNIDPVVAVDPGTSGFKTVVHLSVGPEEALRAFNAVALATPRTRLLGGSIAERQMTYETRSLLWGFPDYTTVRAAPSGVGTDLTVLARQRFGSGDLGVNRARVEQWLAAFLPKTG